MKSQFLKNASVLTIGIFIAQLFNFAIYPILGRMYTPEEFALLANVTSICSILTVVATGRYETSIILCRDRKEAVNVFALAIVSCIVVLLFSNIIFLILGDLICSWLHNSKLRPFLLVSTIISLSIVVFNCYNEWCVREKTFKSLSINKINNSAAVSLAKLFCGYPVKLLNGLVWGDLIGRAVSAIGCIYRLFKVHPSFLRDISIKEIKRCANRYIEFPKFILPGQLLNSLSVALPVFIISSYYNPEITGYYSMALSLLILPVNIISNAIKDVFRQKIVTELQTGRDCRKLIVRLLIPLTIICMLVAICVYPILPFLFRFFIGTRWEPSGVYSQIMLIMAVADFIAMALNGVLLAAEKLRVIFYWQLIFLILTISPLIILGEMCSTINSTLFGFSVCRSIGYIIYVILTFVYLPKPNNIGG